jgi:hypothetical protein
MIQRMYQRFKGSSIRVWMIIGGALGISALPCPECGTPLIFHIWPIALPILAVRALKKRYKEEKAIDSATNSTEMELLNPVCVREENDYVKS